MFFKKSNFIIFFILLFVVSFSFFSYVSATVITCSGEDVCNLATFGDPSWCSQSGVSGYTCDCGSYRATCEQDRFFSCGHAADQIYPPVTCNRAETCVCDAPISGCTNPASSNYNPNAQVDDGSCIPPPPPPINCGNGVVNAGEQCDLGVNNGSCPGGCSSSCTTISCNPPGPSCGDGVVDSGEQCDTGVNNGSCPRTCSNSCTVNTCGGGISTLTFTATGPGTAVSPWGSCRGATCILPLPTGTYVTIDAVHDILGGAFNWQAVCPALGAGARCEGPLNANYSAGVTFAGITVPIVNNISISAPDINANSSTQYTITATASDSGGGGKISQQYALINYQGANAGQYRGYLTWATFSWGANKNNMACSGGGYAAIQSTGGNTGFGHGYLNLINCATSINGGTRTTTFTVTFEPLFVTNGPWVDNDISGYAYNTDGQGNGWKNFDRNFGIITSPTYFPATISSPTVTADGSTQYQITVGGSDKRGGANIYYQLGLVNYQGGVAPAGNEGSHRGYPVWYYDTTYTGWNSYKNKQLCSGGGVAAIYPGYGDTYMNLSGCSTSVSGPNNENRSTVFTVTFDPSFTTPTTNNDISSYIQNKFVNSNGWVNSDINFGLNISPPTVTLSASPTSVSSGGSSTLTWTVSGATGGCTASGGWSGAKTSTNGTHNQIVAPINTTQTFTLTCSNGGGSTASSATVNVSAPSTYTLNVVANPGPGGRIMGNLGGINCPTVTCSAIYNAGDTVILTATPTSSYWKFDRWEVDNAPLCPGTGTCSVTVNNSGIEVRAFFVPRIFIYREF